MTACAAYAERFGGLTAYTRAPAEGAWQPSQDLVAVEDVFVVEVVTPELDRAWWAGLRRQLEETLDQDEVLVRAVPCLKL
ncbi:MAG: hypothetical protein ACXWNB_10525 [Candidatus Binataceae bacterium]